MTPIVDGKVVHLEAWGLYDGLSILRDRETGSLWHHITGEALHGPLTGRKLAPLANVLHTTAAEALAVHPDAQLAVSDRPIRQPSRWTPLLERVPLLGPAFRRTMAREDTRRPTMDVGLGVWTDAVARYYPLDAIRAADNVVVDTLAGRRIVVYFAEAIRAPAAFYSAATAAKWVGDELRLSTGEVVRRGALYGPDGGRRPMERPLQLFTRWYGYALTFPETGVFPR